MSDLPNYPGSGRGIFFDRLLDAINLVFGLLFILALAASLPLAVFLMAMVAF
jgi:hypothetical protein